METDKVKLLKLANSVHKNIALGRVPLLPSAEKARGVLGIIEDGSGHGREYLSPFGNSPDGSWLKAQFVLTNTVSKDFQPNGVRETEFGEYKNDNVVKKGMDCSEYLASGEQGRSLREKLVRIYDKVLVVDNVSKAREVVGMLTTKYRDLIYACDAEGSAADVAMCAMLEIDRNHRLKELGWKLLLQVHDEVILEGPTKSTEIAKAIVVECMSRPFDGKNILKVDLFVDAKHAQSWYAAK